MSTKLTVQLDRTRAVDVKPCRINILSGRGTGLAINRAIPRIDRTANVKLKALAAGTLVAAAIEYVLPAQTTAMLDQPESLAIAILVLSVAVVLVFDRRG